MDMRIRSRSLDRALPTIAGFFTDKVGIPVIRGSKACTDGKTIYLPRRRSEIDLTERDLVESVAYLYHEAGHLLYSDFNLEAETPLKKAIVNILEDVRVERLMMAAYPAARRYLTKLLGMLAEERDVQGNVFAALDGSEPEQVILQHYMVLRLRYEVLCQTPLAELAERAMKVAEARLPAGMLTRLNALMFQITRCASESDVVDLASEIVRMIKEEHQKEDRQKKQEQEEPPQPKSGDEQSDPSGAVPSDGDAARALEHIIGMSDGDVQEGVGEMLQKTINDTAKTESNKCECSSGYDVAMPNVHKAKLGQNDVDMSLLRGSINAIRTETMQWMSSVAESDISHSRSGMRIDPSRIWQNRFGGAIFMREEEGIDLNAAVSIIIDRSGSMCCLIADAAQAATAAMLAFEVPGISTQVSVFPWESAHDVGVAVIKNWDESPKHLARRISSLTAEGSTPMAEALLFAASNAVRREETLKMVLAITDGMPDDIWAVRHIIERARSDGVTVAGLGIGVDVARVFGDRYAATVMETQCLSGAIVKLVRAAFEDRRQQQ